MVNIRKLIHAIDESTLSRKIGIPHDQARNSFHLNKNTEENFQKFCLICGRYYNHHYSRCISNGTRLPDYVAISKAKEILENEAGRRGGNLLTMFNYAKTGTNSGLRYILDVIAEDLKMKAMNQYVTHVFDSMIPRNSWKEKRMAIVQFIKVYGFQFSGALDLNQIDRIKPGIYLSLITEV